MQQADHTQVWIQLIGAVVILVPVILNYLQSRKNAQKVDTVARSLVDEDGNQKIDKVTEKVVELTKNTDGMQTAMLDLTARANQAEGINKGIADEQERTALITEPAQVHDAMNGKDVREQMGIIEKKIDEVQDASTKAADIAAGVAEDLKGRTERADAQVKGKPGEAADAAMRSDKK